MNLIQFAVLIWGLAALAVCLFVHGAKQDRKARGRMEQIERGIQWPIGHIKAN